MDQHTHTTGEVAYHHEPTEGTGRIWKVFWLLLIITVIELGLGLLVYATDFPAWIDMFLKGVIVILSLAKAFYIVTVFMHLGDEIRNMIMTIIVPLLLFIWFIAAFLWDGNDYRQMRNRYDLFYRDQTLNREMHAGDTATHPLQ